MIRGVSFEVPQIRGTILWQILGCIEIEQYCWHSIGSQNEVWDYSDSPNSDEIFTNSNVFFRLDFYDGKSFLKQIKMDHYIIFLKLQAYFDNGTFFDIHTYEEFQESDCQLLLLMYDAENVEIYVKDEAAAKAIYDNAFANSFTKIEYITDDNDSRTGMDIR